jgi:hypothetical protein
MSETDAPVTAAELDHMIETLERNEDTLFDAARKQLHAYRELRAARERLAAYEATANADAVEAVMKKAEEYADEVRYQYVESAESAFCQAVTRLVDHARAETKRANAAESAVDDLWDAVSLIPPGYRLIPRGFAIYRECVEWDGKQWVTLNSPPGGVVHAGSPPCAAPDHLDEVRAEVVDLERIIAEYMRIRPTAWANWGKRDYDRIMAIKHRQKGKPNDR